MMRNLSKVFWAVVVLSLIMAAAFGNLIYTLPQLPISIGLIWILLFLPVWGFAYLRGWEDGLRQSARTAWTYTMIAFLAGWVLGLFIFLGLWSVGKWEF